MPRHEMITALQIAELVGVKVSKFYAANMKIRYRDFPNPVIEQNGQGPSYWIKSEVVAWLAADAANPRNKAGRRMKGIQMANAAKAAKAASGIDLSLAQQFISARRVTS